MANALQKSKNVTFVPGHPAVPANPGQPWMPARTALELVTRCSWEPTTAFSGGAVGFGWVLVPYNPVTGVAAHYEYVLVDTSGSSVSGGSYTGSSTYVCRQQYLPVTYPEQPYIAPVAAQGAVASQTLIDLNLGWNAGARSIAFMRGSGNARFKVPHSVVGAVVGLNDAGTDAGFTNIDFAWYLSGGIARVYEAGVEKFYAGPYATGDEFTVDRMRGTVRYKKNGTTLYTSALSSSGSLFMDASLYSGDDTVYDPVIAEYGIADTAQFLPLASTGRGSVMAHASYSSAAFEPLQSVGGISATMVGQGSHALLRPLRMGMTFGSAYQSVGVSHASFLPLTSTSRVANRGAASLAPLEAIGADHSYGDSRARFAPLTVFAQGGMPVPAYAIANTAMLYLTGGATGLTGEIGGSAASLPALRSLSSGDDSLLTLRTYGESRGSLAPMRGYASAYEGNGNASMQSSVGLFGAMGLYNEVYVVMNSDLVVTGAFLLQRMEDTALHTDAEFSTIYALQTVLNALMPTTVLAGFGVPVFDGDSSVWVLNADTKAASTYEQFGFNSYCQLNGKYYGCLPDGVYLLEGDTDNGLPIRASIDLGAKAFGTLRKKSAPSCYLGVSSAGTMYLKVMANGQTYTYAARRSDAYLRAQRVDIGKGLQATYFRFEVYNSDGCDFDLSTVEFAAVNLDRRI